jgi:CNT family concentrative nucleoside transporter
VAAFLSLSDYGARFLFGNLADPQYFFPGGASSWPGFGFQFAFKVLPTILFFGGFMAVLYYLGIMQTVIEAIARFMRWTVGTSGAETLSCSANIFVGQTEAPLLIKPFLSDMTRSELLTVMVGGFATIAGGVLAAYIAMGIPAGHLIAASVMAAPAALLVGKIIYPELEHSTTAGDIELPDIESGSNVIEAASNGISDGLKLAVNVAAMLVGFIALIAVVDVVLNWVDALVDGSLLHGAYVTYGSGDMSPVVGEFTGIFPGSLQTLFGTLLRPLAWLMGVAWNDAGLVGNLLGIKLSLNELVAYGVLSTYFQDGAMSERSMVIATYALCGFANFSSIGIQIGGISAVAPSRRSDLAQLGLKAMFGGAIASCLTATIAGMLL